MIHRLRRYCQRPANRVFSVRRVRWGILALAGTAAVALLCHGYAVAQVKPAANPPAQAASNLPQATASYDLTGRGDAILAHLNSALRFYRDSEAPVQKIGEPSDLFYRNQAATQATQAAAFAFQSAKAEAALIDRVPQDQLAGEAGSRTQRLQQALTAARRRIVTLKARDEALAKQLASASPGKRAQIEQQRDQVNGELELQAAMESALGRIADMAGGSGSGGFAAQVAQLERSSPGVMAQKATAVAPTLENLSEARSMGVWGQARVVFSLLRTMQTIHRLTGESSTLHGQAIALRAPLITELKKTIAQGQALSQNAAAVPVSTKKKKAGSVPASSASDTEKRFKELTASFKTLSGAAVPLSQEILTLEQNQSSLRAWSAAVDQEYDSILQSLLLRVLVIAISLGIIFIISELWRRGTKRYVHDPRRRRQLFVLRRFVTGFLVGLVLIFGLVTQFSSLATFAGLITAGIAVGLQTVLLSIAAYFFIVGRYGIKAGDRITIAGVTGDVLEVGLLRFYVMEMAGSGTDLYSTGRVAVFSNAVLFQATTPLYKQMPGTEFAWHELVVKLRTEADYRPVADVVLKVIQQVYDGYRQKVEQQHRKLEAWVDSSLDAPAVVSNLQLADGGPELRARFPVIIRHAGAVDDKITELLLELMARDARVKSAISESPVIQATVRG